MTTAIYSTSEHLWGLCSAYFEVYGHTVRRIAYGEPVKADVVIIDHPYGSPLHTMDCALLVVVSSTEVWHPPGSWFYRKPVDLDCIMDRILEFMEK